MGVRFTNFLFLFLFSFSSHSLSCPLPDGAVLKQRYVLAVSVVLYLLSSLVYQEIAEKIAEAIYNVPTTI
jgi:hypothetical protein